MDLDLNRIVLDLSDVYWKEISRDNPSYIYAIDQIRELCNKYGVTYRTSKEDILHDFVLEEGDEDNLLEEIKRDIESTTSKEMISYYINKYCNIRENWRQSIFRYVTNDDQLFDLLCGGMEQISRQLSNFKSREERLKPKKIDVYDENGWLDLETEGRLENESEVQARVDNEDKAYEKMKQDFENMKNLLPKWMEYLTVLPEVSNIYKTLGDTLVQFGGMKNTFILEDFGKDLDFMNQLEEIMVHDKTQYEYLYHGTTCVDDACSILEQGLYMNSDDIYSTTYSEFDTDSLLLYHRGIADEIGSSVVIIKRPVEENIVRKCTNEERENCHVIASGLSGLNIQFDYIIPKEYIVGYVDKENRKVVSQKDLSLEHHTSYEAS